MSNKYFQKGKRHRLPNLVYDYADIAISPREAYFSETKTVDILTSEGQISAESVMIYPPGIPMLIPGEKITKNIINIYSYYVKAKGTIMSDSQIGQIKIVDRKE